MYQLLKPVFVCVGVQAGDVLREERIGVNINNEGLKCQRKRVKGEKGDGIDEDVCVWRKKVLPVLVPRVIITQSNTFSGTSLSTDTSLARNIRKALLRMDTLGLFGFRSVILPEPLSPYFKLEC